MSPLLRINNKAKKRMHETYIGSFDTTDPNIQRKIAHIERVTAFAVQIAKALGLPKEEVALAEFIARHHDDGRFIQWREYKSFSDKDTYPHAQLAIKLLFGDDGQMLKGYIPKIAPRHDEWWIIYEAISQHASLTLDESTLSERKKLHCKIVRDADMLDNMVNVGLREPLEYMMSVRGHTTQELQNGIVSADVYRCFMSGKAINYADIKTAADIWAAHCAYLFNLALKPSFKIVEENDCVSKMIDRVVWIQDVTRIKFDDMRLFARGYLLSQTK